MSTQVVVETKEAETIIHPRYQELLLQFHEDRATDPRERVQIERQILQTFQNAMAEVGIADEQALQEEDLADVLTDAAALVSITMTAATVGVNAANAAEAAGINVSGTLAAMQHVVMNNPLTSLIAGGGASGASAGILLVITLYNLYRAMQTRRKLETAEEDLVKWEKYYMSELDKAEREAMEAVQELVKYFVQREALLRMNREENSGIISYELGMQMARCMHRVERALKRYRELIDKGEETLQAIEDHAQVLTEQATRQKRRGWVAMIAGGVTVVGGIAMIAMSGGTAMPIVTMIMGLTVAGTGGVVFYLSKHQLAKLRSLKKSIGTSKDQLARHRAHCNDLEAQVMQEIRKAEEYVTEAEKEAQLRNQLEEARKQNEALARRFAELSRQPQEDGNAVRAVLSKYRLAKFYDVVVQLGLDTVADLQEIDEDILDEMGCKPIEKKKFLRMIRELAE